MASSDARFAALYDTYYRHVYAYCRRRTDTHHVEDAVADTFLTAWRRLDDVPEGREALLWLYGVAYRVLSHQWRSSNRKRRLDRKLEAAGTPIQFAADHYVIVRDDVRAVLDAASRLADRDIEVLRLAIWEELPHEDIARILDLSSGAVRQRLHRARRNLTQEYERGRRGGSPSTKPREGST